MRIKCDPSKLPKPLLEPTRPVDIGEDKMSYVPEIKKPEAHYTPWTEEDTALLLQLKENGLKNADIAKLIGRSYESVKTKLKMLKGKTYEENENS